MVDFRKLLKDLQSQSGYIEKDEPVTCQIKAIRTHCRTGVKKQVSVLVAVRDGQDGKVFYVHDGGVTGYESFYVKDIVLQGSRDWCCCAGTKGVWDTLVIPSDQMKVAFEYLGLMEHSHA